MRKGRATTAAVKGLALGTRINVALRNLGRTHAPLKIADDTK